MRFLPLFIITCFIPVLSYSQIASDNPHGEIELGISCNSCHQTDAWTPLKENPTFFHNMQTGFPLTGSHTVTNCVSCHIDLKFGEPEAAPTDCATCHVDVHQGSFGQNCIDCHNTTLFQDIEGISLHAQTRFPLTGTHAQLNCISCHTDDTDGAFTPLETACVACHEDDYDNALSVDHVAAGFPLQCETCHNDLQWQGTLFEHVLASNGFDLIGAHDQITCASCHRSPDLSPIFEATSDQNCIGCHQDDYDNEHAGSGFPTTCIDCHNQNTWDDALFDHITASEGFALLGAHEQLTCASCHSMPDLALIHQPPPSSDQECIACHQSDYDDNHAGSGFPTACIDCHNTNTWSDADFDHITASNGFDLLGAHDALQCTSCHSMPDLALIHQPPPSSDQECIACHQSDYDDNHAGSGFPATCIDCHNTNTWGDADFDHITASNGFDLLGAHDALQCTSCHSMPDLALIHQPPPSSDMDCIACHQSDYDNEHAGSGLPTTCLDCHNTNTWNDADFNHLTASNGFDLLGAHDALQCASCHNMPDLSLIFEPPPANDQECIACHQTDYDDNHAGSGLPTTCIDCHNTNNWADADFNHLTASNGFDLLGAHDVLQCASCHNMPDLSLIFEPPPANDQECIACHQTDYDDNHAGSGFPITCIDCHNTNNWADADFDHLTASNGFDLLGAHDALQCASCHNLPDLSLIFEPPPANDQECIACHQNDYDDNHAGSGLPTTCIDCHNTNNWADADFNHLTASNGFDLLGAHNTLQCASCHNLPDLSLIFEPPPANDQECIACHQNDYDTFHAGSGFPTTCLDCHNVDTFGDANFDHITASGGFDLLGAHDALQCASCHNIPDLTLLFEPPPANDQECIACHQSDYDAQHAGSGFSATCLDCHNTNNWNADFDHDAQFFPIYSGNHRNEWTNCQTCHIQPNTFSVFSCEGACHEHTQPKMDAQHNGVNGYAFDPVLCLNCHPNGN